MLQVELEQMLRRNLNGVVVGGTVTTLLHDFSLTGVNVIAVLNWQNGHMSVRLMARSGRPDDDRHHLVHLIVLNDDHDL